MAHAYEQEHRQFARRFVAWLHEFPEDTVTQTVASLLTRHSNQEEVSKEEWRAAHKAADLVWSHSNHTSLGAAFCMYATSFGAAFGDPERAFVYASLTMCAYEARKKEAKEQEL